jgi:hypothetical protein
VFLGAFLSVHSSAEQHVTPNRELLVQPQDWVPVSADVEHRERDGEVLVGRYYRANDGSTRKEMKARDSAGPMRVTIKNVSKTFGYLWAC